MANRITQDAAEVVETAVPSARITQDSAEVVETALATARITQDDLEVVQTATPAARITQDVVEVVETASVKARITADVTEVIVGLLPWVMDGLGSGFSLSWQSFSGPFPWDINMGFGLSWDSPPSTASWSLALGSRFSATWAIDPSMLSPWVAQLGLGFSLAFTPTVGTVASNWFMGLSDFVTLEWEAFNHSANGWHVNAGPDFGLQWVVRGDITSAKCLSGDGTPALSGGLKNYVF